MRVYQFRHLGIKCMLSLYLLLMRFAFNLYEAKSIAYFLNQRKSPLNKRSKNDSNNKENPGGAHDLPPDFDPEVPSREVIMQYLRSSETPVDPEQMAIQLGASVPLSIGFARRLKAMERDGQLFFNQQGLLLLNNKLEFIAGRVQGHRDGFGFLLRDDGGPDLFLSPREMLKVLHGDRVLAKPDGEYRGKAEATIVEVTV